LDPVAIAQLAALGIQIFGQIYSGIQASHADELKPLSDILTAATAVDTSVIASAQAEIAKLTKA